MGVSENGDLPEIVGSLLEGHRNRVPLIFGNPICIYRRIYASPSLPFHPSVRPSGLGFRVWGLGFRVSCLTIHEFVCLAGYPPLLVGCPQSTYLLTRVSKDILDLVPTRWTLYSVYSARAPLLRLEV